MGLLERPCCTRSSTSLPRESSRCLGAPRMGLARRLLLATATVRQPAPPQSPLLAPPPHKTGVLPCMGGTRPPSLVCLMLWPACSCTLQLDHTVRLLCGGCWGADLCPPMEAEQAVGVYPALVGQEVAQAVSHQYFPPSCHGSSALLLRGQCCGHNSMSGLGCMFPSSFSLPRWRLLWFRCLAGVSPHSSGFASLSVVHCSDSPENLC